MNAATLKKLLLIAITVILGLATLWAVAALYFDVPVPALRIPLAVVYLSAVVAAFVMLPSQWPRILAGVVPFVVVLVWWRGITPSNDRVWQADVAQTAWAERDGDWITIHNYRQCDYRSQFDYTCTWTDKRIKLSDIRGVDIFVIYWGSNWIAHPIASFQVGDHDHVAFSIETRKAEGQSYTAMQGFFRKYELIYTVAPESDLVRLRTNFRKGARGLGEDVYLYRTTAGPDWSRLLFLAYTYRINEMHQHAEWYNAVTSNCTTNIFTERAAADNFVRVPTTPLKKLLNKFDWRILLNGKGDKMEYQRGDLVTGGLPFEDLRRQAYINPVARKNQDLEDFSDQIRLGRVGF